MSHIYIYIYICICNTCMYIHVHAASDHEMWQWRIPYFSGRVLGTIIVREGQLRTSAEAGELGQNGGV